MRSLYRTLPGAVDALVQGSADHYTDFRLETLDGAVIGDFGNDLAYGSDARAILAALDRLLGALDGRCPVILMLPPVEAVSTLNPLAFGLVSTMIFPGRRIAQGTVVEQLGLLQQGLKARHLHNPEKIALVDVPRPWMGWDRIHIRRSALPAWAELVAGGLERCWGPRSLRPAAFAKIGALQQLGLRPGKYPVTCLGVKKDLGEVQPCYRSRNGGSLTLC